MRQARHPAPGDVNPAAAAGQGAADREEDAAAAATGAVTIGQALQGVALSPAGDRPMDHINAAAVQAAEESATGQGQGGGDVVPGGVAAVAQRAAEANTRPPPEEARGGGEVVNAAATTLRDVLGDASAVVPGDRAATWVDAEKVTAATRRNGGGKGEVADAVAAAAHMNEGPPL